MKKIILLLCLLSLSNVLFSQTFSLDSFYIDVNRLKLHVNNAGGFGVYWSKETRGTYDGISILFTGGFLMSGYTNDSMWSNGVYVVGNVTDYLPGIVNTDPSNPDYKIYVVKETDPHFGQSWQEWSNAVEQGANFYDGNNNGIYDPVDLNSDGIWDPNEDRPDLLGDVTTCYVCNDGKPDSLRSYDDVTPQGIEIRQTVFASSANGSDPFGNTIFIKYVIENRGTVTPVLDSVYFGITVDADIGYDYSNDYSSVDTLLKVGFTYKDSPDSLYGTNPPSFMTALLQGPHCFLPGETFIDNNFNQVYDEGIDTPLDSAVYKQGPYLGEKIIPGAKNLDLTSFMMHGRSYWNYGYPITKEAARNYLIGGRYADGSPIDPCSGDFGGTVAGVNCNDVNPYFVFSGDPVTNVGWFQPFSFDVSHSLSTGPFKLKENEPVEIIAAYIAGRGDSPLNSITVAKNYAATIINSYDNNFSDLPVSVENENYVTKDFHLYQNHPNPFNPVTKIRYSIPSVISSEGRNLKVTLKVYDILGREITTLVNEEKPSGNYEVEFNGSKYASGVYFYQLKTGNYLDTKKMILLK